jgi:p-aminobenzoyl-glutamate transporter AbgT
MDSDQLTLIATIAQLAEKYGFALVLAIVLLIVVLYIVRMLIRGDLVPRRLLIRAEEDRDRLQAILDKEREGVMMPFMEWLKNIKKDDHGSREG